MEKELSYEEKQERELKDYIMKNTYHTIENALQHDSEVDMIIKINEENDYMYDIGCDNLINSRLLKRLLREGYVILPYYDTYDIVLRHESKVEKHKRI